MRFREFKIGEIGLANRINQRRNLRRRSFFDFFLRPDFKSKLPKLSIISFFDSICRAENWPKENKIQELKR